MKARTQRYVLKISVRKISVGNFPRALISVRKFASTILSVRIFPCGAFLVCFFPRSGSDKRAALIELIQLASEQLLNRIEKSILSSISESKIPAHFINFSNELYLIYFLVLDPEYFQVKCYATKEDTIAGMKYGRNKEIPLYANHDEDQLMLAKVRQTSLNLVIKPDNKHGMIKVTQILQKLST